MHRKPTLCTGFCQCIYYNAAPTCFGTYVPSSGSVFVLVSTWKLRQLCTTSCNVNLIHLINTLTKPSAECWLSIHNPAMHGKNIKLDPTVCFPFTTMLQHTSRFWSRISWQRTTRSTPHTLLTWLQLICIRSLHWNQHWKDVGFVMLLISLRMRRASWKGFHRIVSSSF
jgi:hypothetical protein